ncbi:outer membrane beta-barrel protein [Mucilaginibacter flavus]|uniref:outer membrane beta-barrel protein n=1 Tax=Mucilaginibacter flavus TaxID=931504 RepID=UPI0025B3190C|nr:outer membrane beta-barrel protein [Mucilaginibacter flavus]MDN3584541.1 outer membrane beta-barrel protein [Mucilaginibacter flavus]
MKNSIKTIAIVLGLSACAISAKAQNSAAPQGVVYSIGQEGGIGVGGFKNTYKWSTGTSLQADIPVAHQVYVTVNAGYTNVFGKNNINGTGFDATNIHLLPAMAGIKYFPVSSFYVQADAGAGFLLNKHETGFEKSTVFLYTPQVGWQFHLAGQSYIDAGVRYERTTKFDNLVDNSKLNFIGLRVAYALAVK